MIEKIDITNIATYDNQGVQLYIIRVFAGTYCCMGYIKLAGSEGTIEACIDLKKKPRK